MHESRFIIGIDLGTTNIAVTFVDREKNPEHINLFKVPNFIAPGELDETELFPSFCFFPNNHKIEQFKLPWEKQESKFLAGTYARDVGGNSPNRFVSSAKSWLCHYGVDRKGKILPWSSDEVEIKLSPFEATSYYLKQIKNAWDHKYKNVLDKDGNPCLFEEQFVTITVPASFDETARELTLEGAKKAGYKHLSLLEEPLAAFYSWIHNHKNDWKELIFPKDKILIADIGGGTCDFSIIEVDENYGLNRTVSGNHLLLGGDNIDIALGRSIEKKWNTTLPYGEWLTLCQKTRQAKEHLLSEEGGDSYEVILLSRGSSVVGNARKYTLRKDELEKILLDGFFANIQSDSEHPTRKTSIQKMGLPYESDPAICKHLLFFLKSTYKITEYHNDNDNKKVGISFPNKILFNGGAMIPRILRERVIENVQEWFDGKKISELESKHLSLAVAYGASYYGKMRNGIGDVKVQALSTRSYYIEALDKINSRSQLLCVMPRGTDENKILNAEKVLNVLTNATVNFPLYTSSVRTLDKLCDSIETNEDFSFSSNFNCMIKYGKKDLTKKEIQCTISSLLTENGILKLSLKSVNENNVWPLHFDTRLLYDNISSSKDESSSILDSEIEEKAIKTIRNLFLVANSEISIYKEIENITDIKKEDWPLYFLRKIVDELLLIDYNSLQKEELERKWLNICGYAMRPGFGFPDDIIRIKKIWDIWYIGLQNKNSIQNVIEWWIFWRRVSSGLKIGHHMTIFNELSQILFPKNEYQNNIKFGQQAKVEMWRCLASLELLQEKQKVTAVESLFHKKGNLETSEYWAIARIGARRLFHAKSNNVVHKKYVEKWINTLLKDKLKNIVQEKLFCVSKLAAITEDRAINIEAPLFDKCKVFLSQNNASNSTVNYMENPSFESQEEKQKTLGDSIPLGISFSLN